MKKTPHEPKPGRRRRTRALLKGVVRGGKGAGRALAYPFLKARRFRITRKPIAIPGLPLPFHDLTIAFLTDIHHGPFFGLKFVKSIVEATNQLDVDVITLGGDYVHIRPKYIEPCIRELGRLTARLGTFAVLGNHDHWESAPRTIAALRAAGITDLTNAGVWLRKGAARLRLCGVDDMWAGAPDLAAALGDCRRHELAVLVSHNPHYVDGIRDPRVGLVLSGHTHGGQIRLPLIGPPILNLKHRTRYVYGLVTTPHTQVYVSSGLGAVFPFVRYRCQSEIVVLRLTPSSS